MNFTTYKTSDLAGEPYRVYLDSKKIAVTASYNEVTKSTSFNLVHEYGLSSLKDLPKIGVVFPSGKYQEAQIENGRATISGEHTAGGIVIGFPYETHIRLSPVHLHSERSERIETNLTGRLQLRYIRLNYADTGGFTVTVTYRSGRTCRYIMTARIITDRNDILGRVPCDTGVFKIPIQSLNTDATIDIRSDLPLPLSLIGFLWEGSYVARSKGV